MNEFHFGSGGGYWSDPGWLQNGICAAVTLAVAIGIGLAWERWRPRRR